MSINPLITTYLRMRLLVIIPVGVEKLAHSEFAKIGSRQEALQTIFPSRLDIFYHPIFDLFQKNRLFQQPHKSITSVLRRLSEALATSLICSGRLSRPLQRGPPLGSGSNPNFVAI